MGIPQEPPPQQEQQQQPPPPPPPPPPPASSTTPATAQLPQTQPATHPTLPPEALDLAHKLFDLARGGHTTLLASYLTAGIPANLTNHKGDTLLMLAAYHGHLATVRMLIQQHGADVNVLNDRGQSPIAGAVFKGYDEVVACLWREGGADLAAGQPNAVEAARMFRREAVLGLFGLQEE